VDTTAARRFAVEKYGIQVSGQALNDAHNRGEIDGARTPLGGRLVYIYEASSLDAYLVRLAAKRAAK
jgi:hypothetical protein